MIKGSIKRKSAAKNIIAGLLNAHKLIFAPLTFQAIASLIDFGILQKISITPLTIDSLIKELNLPEYVVSTLLQVAEASDIVIKSNKEEYSLTKTGEMFLYDEMTIINFNFVKDVCYLGASELTNSFKDSEPRGLHKFIGKYDTIYPALTKLPDKIKKSWYSFDHLYSDNCFNQVFKIINSKYNNIFDIGGNTGKFEQICLKNTNCNITLLDLSENIQVVMKNPKLKGCNFYPINVLDKNVIYPDLSNSAILMSQFLDCFSKKQIMKILTDLKRYTNEQSTLYILEPFTDMQQFEAASLSLKHISLYFTCMANGVSKMYTKKEMLNLLQQTGYKINTIYNNIGPFDYTLLECKKNEMVSN